MDLVSSSTPLPDKEAQDECDISLSEETKRQIYLIEPLRATHFRHLIKQCKTIAIHFCK